MTNKYYVYMNKKYYGPLGVEDIKDLILKKKISTSNYLYDTKLKYVFMIGEHKDYIDLLPTKPKDSLLHNHYILIRNNELADVYSHDGLRHAIAENMVSIYDYVYIPQKNSINKIKDLTFLEEMFPCPPLESPSDVKGKENIVSLKDSGKLSSLLPGYTRKYPRAPFSAPTRVEFEGSNYIGNCSVIGEGGCFLELKNVNLKPGDILNLNIVSELIHLEIIVTVEVTSLVREYKSGVGVRFIDLKPEDKKKLVDYINRYIDRTIA